MMNLINFARTNRSFLFLITAQFISNIGDWLYLLALFAWIAIKWQGQPLAISGLMLCMILPSILCGSWAGSLADRYARKQVMITADLIRACLVASLLLTHSLWQVYLIVTLESLVSTFFEPAKQGKLKELIRDADLQQAVGLSEIITNGTKILGPGLSGFLVSLTGISDTLALNAASFIASALILTALPRSPKNIAAENTSAVATTTKPFNQWFSGFLLIKRTPVLLKGMLIFSLMLAMLQLADSQTVTLLRQLPLQSIKLLGICMAASGAGLLLSALVLSTAKSGNRLSTLFISPLILGVGLFATAVLIHLPISFITVIYPLIFATCGFSFNMAAIPFNVRTQQLTKQEDTGKVFGTINSVMNLAAIIGVTIGGVVSELTSVQITFLTSGALLIITGMSGILGGRIKMRNEDTRAESHKNSF